MKCPECQSEKIMFDEFTAYCFSCEWSGDTKEIGDVSYILEQPLPPVDREMVRRSREEIEKRNTSI